MIPLAASASRWLLSGGWKWAGMGMCVLAVLFYRHEAASQSNRADAAIASIGPWQQANAVNLASVKVCTAALHDQNAHVRALADVGQAKQNAAQAALRGATARAERAEVLASRIDAERAQRGSAGGCRSGEAVMAAKSEL